MNIIKRQKTIEDPKIGLYLNAQATHPSLVEHLSVAAVTITTITIVIITGSEAGRQTELLRVLNVTQGTLTVGEFQWSIDDPTDAPHLTVTVVVIHVDIVGASQVTMYCYHLHGSTVGERE